MTEKADGPALTTATSMSLLEGLRSASNRTAWQQFDARYRPVIVGVACRRGLTEADAQDAAQQVLLEFFRSYQQGKYERAKGRLRHWLMGIARRQISNFLRNLPPEVQVPDPTSQTNVFERLEDPGSDTELDEVELVEWRRGVYEECLVQVRNQFDAQTVKAFLLHGLEGKPAKEVAGLLGITPNAVFLAKHKIVKRIQELLPQLEEAW